MLFHRSLLHLLAAHLKLSTSNRQQRFVQRARCDGERAGPLTDWRHGGDRRCSAPQSGGRHRLPVGSWRGHLGPIAGESVQGHADFLNLTRRTRPPATSARIIWTYPFFYFISFFQCCESLRLFLVGLSLCVMVVDFHVIIHVLGVYFVVHFPAWEMAVLIFTCKKSSGRMFLPTWVGEIIQLFKLHVLSCQRLPDTK